MKGVPSRARARDLDVISSGEVKARLVLKFEDYCLSDVLIFYQGPLRVDFYRIVRSIVLKEL